MAGLHVPHQSTDVSKIYRTLEPWWLMGLSMGSSEFIWTWQGKRHLGSGFRQKTQVRELYQHGCDPINAFQSPRSMGLPSSNAMKPCLRGLLDSLMKLDRSHVGSHALGSLVMGHPPKPNYPIYSDLEVRRALGSATQDWSSRHREEFANHL